MAPVLYSTARAGQVVEVKVSAPDKAPPAKAGTVSTEISISALDPDADGDGNVSPLEMEIYSSKAGKFELNKHRQIKYMHLNLRLLGALPSDATGPLAELAGVAPLSAETESLITLTRARHGAPGV